MADQFIYSMTDTWSDGGTTWVAIKMNVTDSASTSDSKLIELQVGGNTKFAVRKDGNVTLTSNDAGAAGPVMTFFHDSASPAAVRSISVVMEPATLARNTHRASSEPSVASSIWA
jgi:hypothetical protein